MWCSFWKHHWLKDNKNSNKSESSWFERFRLSETESQDYQTSLTNIPFGKIQEPKQSSLYSKSEFRKISLLQIQSNIVKTYRNSTI